MKEYSIVSINNIMDDANLENMIIELEERKEMICVAYACWAAARPCVGHACGAGCIGITVCPLGAHAPI